MINPPKILKTLVIGTLIALAPGCSKDPPGATLELKLTSGPKNLSRADITKLPPHELEHSDKDYKGALLREVLGPIPPNATLRVKAADGYTQTLTAAIATRDDCLLAYEKEDAPLTPPEGPLRIIVPKSPGLSVHNIVSIEVLP